MDKKFRYSVLKYRPSYLLDERINVGVLFVFETDQQVIFEFPKQLKRLKEFYPSLDLGRFRKYLDAFKRRANSINEPLFVESPTVIEDNFFVKDAAGFFFTDFKEGFYISIDQTKSFYLNEFLGAYGQKSFDKHDDSYLRKSFKRNSKSSSKIKQKNYLYLSKNQLVSQTILV